MSLKEGVSMDVNAIGQERQNLNSSVKEVLKVEKTERDVLKQFSEDDIKKAVEKLNKLFEDRETHVEYEIYGKFKDITIKIIENSTKKVVKEIPPKKLIDMVDKLCELAGMFVDDKV